jgi:hypothetical protein
MMVDDFSFGRIVIDGRVYTSDVIVGRDFLQKNWWRREGHRVGLEDVRNIVLYKPEIVIFGTGVNGRVKVEKEVIESFEKQGVKVYVKPTGRAIELYNELLNKGKRVLLAVHITC